MVNRLIFPNPRQANADGLVAVGGNLQIETLVQAYRQGIFPWPHDNYPLLWFCPDPRGVLDFKDLHIPRSLERWSRQHPNWRYTHNQAFLRVIQNCARQPRPGQDGTWINPQIVEAYQKLFQAGFAHSWECWEQDELIGGIYGVDVDGHFSGESMFHTRSNASKMCFWRMVLTLQSWGRTWCDIQMLTSVTQAMGGKMISRDEFLDRLGPAAKVQPSGSMI